MSLDPASSSPNIFCVTEEQAGGRLDAVLAAMFDGYSRAHLRKAIDAGGALVEGKRAKPSCRLRAGEQVQFVLPDLPREGPLPEAIPLDILYEDEHLAAVNKPPGMVVHPAKGHWSGTLASAAAYHFGALSTSGGPTRPGVVHRLDRDTSGVIVLAKTDAAHFALAKQFEARTTQKEYWALVQREPELDADLIDRSLGPHPQQRDKMAIREGHPDCRTAQTFYEVVERFGGYALLRVKPKTGRTHQIRVHLAAAGCPVLCDRLYGGRSEISRGEIARDAPDEEILLSRQALHALRLKLAHPATGEPIEFEAPLPADLQAVLEALRKRAQIGR
jgi:23S rRNA pseudouridine1911/1915/1917 synthase